MGSRNRAARWRWLLAHYEACGGICPDCGRAMDLLLSFTNAARLPHHATIDHVTPRAYGGSDAQANLRLCCAACNQRRGEETNRQRPGPGARPGQRERETAGIMAE